MNFLANLHVVMTIVAVVMFLCAWPMFNYRRILRDALAFALEPAVKETIDPRIHRERTEQAQEELVHCDNIRIPIFQIGLLCLGGLWFALAYEVASATMIGVVAMIVAGAMTLTLSNNIPMWFTDWSVAMMAARNKHEADRIQKLIKEDVAKMQDLINKAESGQELTDEEQMAVVRLTIRLSSFEATLKQLNVQSDAIIEYSKLREDMKANASSDKSD